MKSLFFVRFSFVALFAAATFLLYVDAASLTEVLKLTNKPFTLWKWGEPTNGVVAGVFVRAELTNSKEFRILLFLHEAFNTNEPPPTFTSEPARSRFRHDTYFGVVDNPTRVKGSPEWRGVFFPATNSLSALLELRDQQGEIVSLLNPASDYPAWFRLRQLGNLNQFKRRLATPLGGRLPELARFNLSDCFALNKPGEYQLTVWPKVYKRLKENDDLCQRMDLPAVTINIKCDGELGK